MFEPPDRDDPLWLMCPMKLNCPCGNQVSDTTDLLSYKAHLVADQDLDDLVNAAKSVGGGLRDAVARYRRHVYQCSACKRLLLLFDDEVHAFSADDPAQANQVLRSVEGEQWKRNLRARWRNGRGEVWWGFGVEDQGFETDFATWDAVETRYFEVFRRLKKGGLLRESVLDRESTTVHIWPAR